MSEDKHYVGEVGTLIRINCQEDISSATTKEIKVVKPAGASKETDTFTATVSNSNYLEYVIQADDFDAPGIYTFYPSVDIGTWSGLGEPDQIVVEDNPFD